MCSSRDVVSKQLENVIVMQKRTFVRFKRRSQKKTRPSTLSLMFERKQRPSSPLSFTRCYLKGLFLLKVGVKKQNEKNVSISSAENVTMDDKIRLSLYTLKTYWRVWLSSHSPQPKNITYLNNNF